MSGWLVSHWHATSGDLHMGERATTEGVLKSLYAARCNGELASLCDVFDMGASFRIAGTSSGKPIAMAARGMAEIRPWLALLIKSFKVSDQTILSLLVDDNRAAVHWHASILSRITGAAVPTELFDLIEIRERKIVSYVELFLPR
jgi:ketosteroid isomerase-like protein